MTLIDSESELTGAAAFNCLFDRLQSIPTYDDTFGELYVYRQSCGPWMVISGIVRALSWEDAFSIARDEFATAVDWDDLTQECKRDNGENGQGCDCHAFADNNGLVEIDANERLDSLTPADIKAERLALFTRPL